MGPPTDSTTAKAVAPIVRCDSLWRFPSRRSMEDFILEFFEPLIPLAAGRIREFSAPRFCSPALVR